MDGQGVVVAEFEVVVLLLVVVEVAATVATFLSDRISIKISARRSTNRR